MEILNARAEDLEDVCRLFPSCFTDIALSFIRLKKLMRLYLDASCLFLLAKEDEQLIGFACVARSPRSMLAQAFKSFRENYSFLIPGNLGLLTPTATRLLWRQCAYFSFLCIDSRHRGKGLGKMLFADVLRRLKEQGYSEVAYEIDVGHQVMYRICEEFGFKLENKTSRGLTRREIRSKQI